MVPTPGIIAEVPAIYVVPPMVKSTTVNRSPSGSVSLVSIFPETGVSSGVL